MAKSVSCPKCKQKLKLRTPTSAAKRLRCPKCKELFTVKRPKTQQQSDSLVDTLEEFDGDFGSAVHTTELQPARIQAKATSKTKGNTKVGAKVKKKGGVTPKRRLVSGKRELPLKWMIVILLIVVTGFGWAFSAASYAHSEEGWRNGGGDGVDNPGGARGGRRGAMVHVARATLSSAADFSWNALRQIPNAPAVVSHTFRKRLWLVGVIALAYGTVLLLGRAAGKIQEQMADERRRMI